MRSFILVYDELVLSCDLTVFFLSFFVLCFSWSVRWSVGSVHRPMFRIGWSSWLLNYFGWSVGPLVDRSIWLSDLIGSVHRSRFLIGWSSEHLDCFDRSVRWLIVQPGSLIDSIGSAHRSFFFMIGWSS